MFVFFIPRINKTIFILSCLICFRTMLKAYVKIPCGDLFNYGLHSMLRCLAPKPLLFS